MSYEPYEPEMLDKILTTARKHPVGTRVTHDGSTYTVVALRIVYTSALPVLLDDDDLNRSRANFQLPQEILERGEEFTPAPGNADISARARALARTNRESLCQYGNVEVMWDTPADTEQVDAFLAFADADREWRIAERAQIKAAEERAIRIAQVAWRAGDNQSAAGRLLGLDQSRVSRAIETARELTGADRP